MLKIWLIILLSSYFCYADYLHDPKNRVSNKFKISKFFKPSVNFWYQVYTKYPSSKFVIHDKKIYDLIYGSSSNEKKFKKDLIEKFTKLKANYYSNPKLLKKVQKHIKLPKNKKKRAIIINKLIKNLRGQRGQKDMIKSGLVRFANFEKYLLRLAKEFNLPKELIAITFLESSFNPKAHSKAYAAGAWQFMPLIASYFLPRRNRYIDYRFNIILSSIAAFHLLKQNIQILKSYDLAITSYNSGTKSIIKAKRRFNRKVDLEFIIKNYKKSKSFGFASKNFYAEFLALTRVLAYKNEIFNDLPKSSNKKYYIYSSNCKFNSKVIINKDINNHIFSFNKVYKKGTLFISRNNFKTKRFTKIPFKKFKRNYPKFFSKRFGNRCL